MSVMKGVTEKLTMEFLGMSLLSSSSVFASEFPAIKLDCNSYFHNGASSYNGTLFPKTKTFFS